MDPKHEIRRLDEAESALCTAGVARMTGPARLVGRPIGRRRRSGGAVFSALAATLLVLGLTLQPAIASTQTIDLGKPTASLSSNANFPLSGFHRTSRSFPALRSHGLPELLWIGTAWPGDSASDAERWPLAKALLQFGTFSGIVAAKSGCGNSHIVVGANSQRVTITPCSIPTLDWATARYRSRYLAFVHRDLIDARAHLYQRLTPSELSIFNRYLRQSRGSSALSIGASIYSPASAPTGSRAEYYFPLIAIGNYVQTMSQTPLIGDMTTGPDFFSSNNMLKDGLPSTFYDQLLTFDQVRNALVSGKTPGIVQPLGYPSITFPSLVADVNGEANVIVALICHADGRKPATVCGRTVVKQILKHVK